MNLIRNRICKVLVIALILGSFTPVSLISKSAEASVAGSQVIMPDGKTSFARDIEEGKVRRMLENKIVAERLKGHGLTKEEVLAKMDTMSDAQIHQLASLSDRIPAGGNGAIALAVGVLVVAILVLLVIYLAKRV